MATTQHVEELESQIKSGNEEQKMEKQNLPSVQEVGMPLGALLDESKHKKELKKRPESVNEELKMKKQNLLSMQEVGITLC